ncbi:hypothetical protein GEV33_002007 [Tenebrio molitor]|uniref:Uncharacterized protein n=1 Tax=Tenebrio molitor TaxID=7067 RepID=A0A8J6HTZ1_TENMO|nr:hypothetical protein GEV33_002007 [Tenebrio molitor]
MLTEIIRNNDKCKQNGKLRSGVVARSKGRSDWTSGVEEELRQSKACVRNFLRRDVLSSAESFINLALNSQIIPALHHVQFSHFGTFPARPCFLLVEQDVGVRRRRRFATGGDAATLPLQLKLRRDATQHKAVSGRTQAP